MTEDHIAEVKSLEALIGGSFPTNLSKLSSSSRTIPANGDFHSLYKSDEFKRPIDEIARTSQSVLETIGGKKSMTFPGDDDAYESLVKVNDEILEKFDDSIDEFKRNRKMEEDSKKAIDVKVAESDKRFEKHGKAKAPFHLPTITKPQEEYKILVDNENKSFDHVLLEKSEDGHRFIHPLVSPILRFVSFDFGVDS